MNVMMCRGVRGATTVTHNDRDEILEATRQLLALMIRQNAIDPKDVASAIFTVTSDLDAEFPALAARQIGWMDVPLICTHEISVPGSLPLCVRILLHWNTDKAQDEIHHVYVRDAVRLRPDLCQVPEIDWKELEHWIEKQMAGMKQVVVVTLYLLCVQRLRWVPVASGHWPLVFYLLSLL